jgi:hypothetical protein
MVTTAQKPAFSTHFRHLHELEDLGDDVGELAGEGFDAVEEAAHASFAREAADDVVESRADSALDAVPGDIGELVLDIARGVPGEFVGFVG